MTVLSSVINWLSMSSPVTNCNNRKEREGMFAPMYLDGVGSGGRSEGDSFFLRIGLGGSGDLIPVRSGDVIIRSENLMLRLAGLGTGVLVLLRSHSSGPVVWAYIPMLSMYLV